MAILPNLVAARRLILAAAVALQISALVMLALMGGHDRPASAAFPGYNGKLVFSTNRDGNSEIYSMNADGTGPTRLTNTSAPESYPRWSPDGSQIAFDSRRDGSYQIYVMNEDGAAQTRLTNNSSSDMQPAWSPDAGKITFTSWRTGAWQIYVMNADGSGQTQLTSGIAQNWGPAWSLDGNKIAFSSDRDGSYNVYLMNPDGSNQVSLTNSPANESAVNWSPDGAKLAYVSGADISTMNADGSNKVNLTSNVGENAFPAWSPDGTRIAFQSMRDGNSEIYVMNADGSAQTRIVGTNVTEDMVDWQPICDATGCPTPAPIPSPTPCPEEGCPTPPPTATATPPPTPGPGDLDFSIGISDSDGILECDSSGAPTATCAVPAGAPFHVNLYLNQLPIVLLVRGYIGYDSTMLYQGVTLAQGNLNPQRWPACAFAGYYADSAHVTAGCAVGVGQPGSTYTGLMTTIYFTCTSSGTITLQHGSPFTDLVDKNNVSYAEPGLETLQINCIEPEPYPVDTDTDRCPDMKEAGSSAMMGGQRDFRNPWDYFNPTHDGKIRIDDILAVVQHYGKNQGDPGYSPAYDRSYIGPNRWNLGPPDGTIRTTDILESVSQYGHDCS